MFDTQRHASRNLPIALTSLVLLMNLLGVFPIDVILPSFQAISAHLQVQANEIALTVSSFVLAVAVSQLVIGPLSDKVGRKRLLAAGLLMASAGAAGCMLVSHYELFVAFRIVQALGCGCFVLTQPLIQDMLDGTQRNAARIIQITASGFFISISPLIGSWLQSNFSWRSSFVVFIALAGLTLLIGQRTIKNDCARSGYDSAIMQSYLRLMRDKLFICYSILAALGFACHFSFIVVSPLLFMDMLQFTPYQFSIVFIFYGAAYVIGGVVATFINRRAKPMTQIVMGVCLVAMAGGFILGWHWINEPSAPSLLLPMVVSTAGTCLCRCAATTCALERRPAEAGASSALLGAMVFAIGAVASSVMSLLNEHLPVGLGTGFLLAALGSAGLIGMIRRAPRGSGATIS